VWFANFFGTETFLPDFAMIAATQDTSSSGLGLFFSCSKDWPDGYDRPDGGVG